MQLPSVQRNSLSEHLRMSDVEKFLNKFTAYFYETLWLSMCVHFGHYVYVPTTLFITVVATIVVSITVPEAANTVAILAVKLILLALPGSCREKEEEQSFQRQIISIQQMQRAVTVQELDKKQPSLSSADILTQLHWHQGNHDLLCQAQSKELRRTNTDFSLRKQAELSWGCRSGAQRLTDWISCGSISQHKRRLIDSYWNTVRRKAE